MYSRGVKGNGIYARVLGPHLSYGRLEKFGSSTGGWMRRAQELGGSTELQDVSSFEELL